MRFVGSAPLPDKTSLSILRTVIELYVHRPINGVKRVNDSCIYVSVGNERVSCVPVTACFIYVD